MRTRVITAVVALAVFIPLLLIGGVPFNVLVFAMYTGPKEGYLIGSLIFLSTYFIMIIIIIVGVNLKIKTR